MRTKLGGDNATDVRETTASIMSGFFIYGLGILTGPIIFRVLGADGRGNLHVLFITHQTAVFLVSFGVPGAAAFYADRRSEGSLAGTGAVLAFVYAAPFMFLGWIFAPAIAGENAEQLTYWLRLSMLVVPFGIFHLLVTEMLRSSTAGVRFNVHRNSPVLWRTALIVGAAVLGQLTLGSGLGITVLAFALGYVFSSVAVLNWDRWRFDMSIAKELTSYGIRRWLSIASNTVLIRLDQIIMIPMLPRDDLGVYVVAITVAGVLRPVSAGFGSVIMAQLRRGKRTQDKVLSQSLKASSYSLIPVALMIAATAWFLVPLVFGDEADGAVWPLLILLPGEVLAGLATVYNGYMSAQGAPGRASLSKVISAVFTVVALLIAIPIWGIIGAATVTSLSYLLEFVVIAGMTKRMAPEELDIGNRI